MGGLCAIDTKPYPRDPGGGPTAGTGEIGGDTNRRTGNFEDDASMLPSVLGSGGFVSLPKDATHQPDAPPGSCRLAAVLRSTSHQQ